MDKEKTLARYTKVAPRYDAVVSISAKVGFFPIERYRRQAVEAMNVGEGDTVLEIGCGTGANFPYIQERIGPSGRLITLDYTPGMLEQAAKRVEKHGWQNVQFIQGDAAEVAKLVTGPVDGAVSTFCLSIVPGWERAIAGAAALLRPGGRFVVLDFLTMKPKGPLRVLSPIVKWWTDYYGFADSEVDYSEPRPWKATMEECLANVSYEETYLGTTLLCYGEKA
jgi:demethylmenaquinone methyltransferase/2-methoxy-6-polyprenyl-1,4-benzoquinol methylase